MPWLHDTFAVIGARMARLDSAHWPIWIRYVIAILYVCAATLLRLILPLDAAPYLLYMPGLLAAGFALGRGPGLGATILSGLTSVSVTLFRADTDFYVPGQLLGLVLYLAIGSVLVINCDFLRGLLARRRDDLLALQATNAALLESRTALEASEAFLRSTLESSPDCIKVLDLETRVTFMNERGKEAMDVKDFSKIEGCPWPDFWRDSGLVAAKAAIAEALAGRSARFQGHCETIAGVPKWWDVVVAPILDTDGKPERLLAISRDITEQKRAEAQQRLLNHELGHRLKNSLAMVQAIANQTIKRAGSLAEARVGFESRLIALGKAQDVLTGTYWESAALEAVVRNALAPHGAGTGRFRIQGPVLRLSSRCSLALSLALHELATNATKYGALSTDTGSVTVEWNVEDIEGQPMLRLFWQEMGGPAVEAPQRTGFGSVMIERSLAGYFKGKAHIDYRAEGVYFTLVAPVTRVEAEFSNGDSEILAGGEP